MVRRDGKFGVMLRYDCARGEKVIKELRVLLGARTPEEVSFSGTFWITFV